VGKKNSRLFFNRSLDNTTDNAPSSNTAYTINHFFQPRTTLYSCSSRPPPQSHSCCDTTLWVSFVFPDNLYELSSISTVDIDGSGDDCRCCCCCRCYCTCRKTSHCFNIRTRTHRECQHRHRTLSRRVRSSAEYSKRYQLRRLIQNIF